MADPYRREAPKLNLGSNSSLAPSVAPKPKSDPLADFLRMAGGVLPAVGTGVGAGIGGLLGAGAGGVGAIPGAAAGGMIGGAAGTALGGGATYASDQMALPQQQAEQARMQREIEKQARAQAALSLLGRV